MQPPSPAPTRWYEGVTRYRLFVAKKFNSLPDLIHQKVRRTITPRKIMLPPHCKALISAEQFTPNNLA